MRNQPYLNNGIYAGIARLVVFIAVLSVCTVNAGSTENAGSPAEIHVFDVGYGDAVFMVFPDGFTVLMDGGYEQYGKSILGQIRSRLTKKHLDWMICSHPHPDHIGGLYTVAESIDVDTFITNMEPAKHQRLKLLEHSLRKRNPNTSVMVLTRGSIVCPSKSLRVTVLHPRSVTGDLNYSSLAFMFEYHKIRILFGGDLEQTAERELVEQFDKGLRAHILKLPHHANIGYNDFIPAVKPRIGIISVGPNEWGAPHEQTINALNHQKTLIMRTDVNGGMVLRLYENGTVQINPAKGEEQVIKVIP